MDHRIKSILLTGLSGAGKTTIAYKLSSMLTDHNSSSTVLDGDDLRTGLNSDLKFSKEDRAENARRIAEVAKLFYSNGIIPIISIIAPYEQDREMMRNIIGSENFLEVFVDCPIAVCRSRDPKGLYQHAEQGIIKEFTGVSAAYEIPKHPDFVINTNGTVKEGSLYDLIEKIYK